MGEGDAIGNGSGKSLKVPLGWIISVETIPIYCTGTLSDD